MNKIAAECTQDAEPNEFEYHCRALEAQKKCVERAEAHLKASKEALMNTIKNSGL